MLLIHDYMVTITWNVSDIYIYSSIDIHPVYILVYSPTVTCTMYNRINAQITHYATHTHIFLNTYNYIFVLTIKITIMKMITSDFIMK